MIRVYVETNFLVDILRPMPTSDAMALRARNGVDLKLVVPWCSVKEVERTLLDRVIDEDVGFADEAGNLWASMAQDNLEKWRPHGHSVQKFLNEVRQTRRTSREGCVKKIEAFAKTVEVIQPSGRATERVLEFSRLKRLKPFDEMILGSVLADAENHLTVEAKLFCSVNYKDFQPSDGNNLAATYDEVGLSYLDNFRVP